MLTREVQAAAARGQSPCVSHRTRPKCLGGWRCLHTNLRARRMVVSGCLWEGQEHIMIKLVLTSNTVCTKIFNEYAVKIKPTEERAIQFYWFIFQFIKLTHWNYPSTMPTHLVSDGLTAGLVTEQERHKVVEGVVWGVGTATCYPPYHRRPQPVSEQPMEKDAKQPKCLIYKPVPHMTSHLHTAHGEDDETICNTACQRITI